MKKLLLFATELEAKATLSKLKAKQIEPHLYRYDEGSIVITGFGILAAHGAVLRYGKEADEIVNLGIAGSLNSLPLETIVSINRVGKYTPFPETLDKMSCTIVDKTFPSFTLPNGDYRLITSDFPLHHASLKKTLANDWDIVDMEGYGIIHAANLLGRAVKIKKIVSDFASENGRELIHKNMEKYSQALARQL